MPRDVRAHRPLVSLLVVLMSFAASAPTPASAQSADQGEWSPLFDTPNVMIHVSVLPDGKVLFWGRREAGEGLNPPAPRNCQPRIWDPSKGTGPAAFSTTNMPGHNLFCSGHSFLPDGRLFVAGGHIADGKGEPFAVIYDPAMNHWDRVPELMTGGRWYPTVVTLADGGVLVSFGTGTDGTHNPTQQIWKDGHWMPNQNFDFPPDVLPFYPRMHVAPSGQVFMTGPLPLTQLLDTVAKKWMFLRPDPDIHRAIDLSSRKSHFLQEYAPSVMYDEGKVLYAGGGDGPIADAETIDFTKPMAAWEWVKTDPMNFPRRQHNATLLPDGTVVVMGGTKGNGFNNLVIGQPLRSAELWDPKTGKWKKLAKAAVDRCYHSTAVLLPDATVLNAGGGEYSPNNDGHPNPPVDTHHDAQIFSPPYLFLANGTRAPRPDITSAPTKVKYGETFTVGTTTPGAIGKVSWVRLSSVTHSFNSNQRINFLTFTPDAASLKVTAPADPNGCPPGHYMLFLLNNNGVPSIAQTIQILP
ncbi:galactose oxidase-like domain-containing protein [Paludisphaera rhizosphaerae]|uniref:galactose oxidase-like domain-containing protein n=1 Tax=Paludisphaera rhizosphaerae TaxID=2711216 RepID=UPI0013ECC526|nr:galactose oxidase-like domain-containing protein [Paludisphaera rhizosphaerae]